MSSTMQCVKAYGLIRIDEQVSTAKEKQDHPILTIVIQDNTIEDFISKVLF